MRDTDTFRQYIWLVNTILHSKRISFERIQKLWIDDDLNSRKSLSRTTFYRLRQAIEDMFGIIIQCDNNDGYQYYISNPEALKDHSTQTWMLQTLTVNNILVDSVSIKKRLVLEEIPKGMEHLQTIIKAIKNNLILIMTHQSFDSSTPKSISIEPYCLKVFRQRWYLLGKIQHNPNELRIYALDRILNLEETTEPFVMDPVFNATEFFKNFFGVFIGNEKEPVRIVLRAYGNKMVSLLRTLPKHPSQREIAIEKDYSDFEYFLAPTLDLQQEILKEGPELEVLEPKALRDQITTSLLDSLAHYQNH